MKLLTAQTYRILEKRAETALIGDLLIILRIDQEIETRKKKSSAAIRNRIIAEDFLCLGRGIRSSEMAQQISLLLSSR